jgi:ATP-dependent Clp protease, protease subunit
MSRLQFAEQFFNENIHFPSRTIYLGYGRSGEDDIDLTLASNIIKGLKLLEFDNSKEDIHIILNSLGGDVQHGLAIYDTIRQLECTVNITVTGHCYSMAAWILQAADNRNMTKHSSMMIHEGDNSVSGRSQDAKNWHTFYGQQDDVCVNILLGRVRERNPTFPKSKLVKMLKQDTILWAPEALELGLIDNIIGD